MTTTEPGSDSAASPGLWPSVAGVAGTTLALVVLGRIWSLVNPWVATIAGVAALATAARFRRGLYRWLVSLPFSVGLLGAILLATVLGTIIVQGAPPAAFAERYPSLGGLLRLAGLDDVFHSFAFRGLMALLAASLALVVIDKRGWRPDQWFFVLNHGGVIVILAGGVVGSYAGCKGFIDINEGKVAREFTLRDRFGNSTREKIPLDFGLRLDKFEIERLPPEYRFYVYTHEKDGWRPVFSRGMNEAMEWTEAGSTGKSFRVLNVYQDFEMRSELRDAPEGKGAPGLQVQMLDRDGNAHLLTLLAGVRGRDRTLFKESRSYLHFVWEESQINISTETLPERHMLVYRRGGTAGPDEKVEVRPGQTVILAGEVEATVLEWYPDFVYDSERNEGSSKSREPDNPAVKISLAGPGGFTEGRFLVANTAGDKGTPAAGLLLRYSYVPERKPAEREIVVVGSTKEVLEFRRGELRGRTVLPARSEEPIARGISATVRKVSPRVEEVPMPVTRSNIWRKPVAEVEIQGSGKVEKQYLRLAMPFDLGRGENVLVFQPKPDDIKSFRSRLSILSGNNAVLQDTISVNHPLSYGGYRFYQSNYRKEDPTYSGILVVKDPGLSTAYIGFLMISLGAVCRFYVNPWLIRRRQKKAG